MIFIIENLRKPVAICNLSEVFDSKSYASALSFESQLTTVIVAVMAPLIGFFADTYGVGNAIAITSAVLIILTPLYRINKHK